MKQNFPYIGTCSGSNITGNYAVQGFQHWLLIVLYDREILYKSGVDHLYEMLPPCELLHYPAVCFPGQVEHDPVVDIPGLSKFFYLRRGKLPAIRAKESSVVKMAESKSSLS